MKCQGPRIDFQSEMAKVVLYLVPPRGASMADDGGENFVFWFSTTQKTALLDAFSKNFVFVPHMFLCSVEKCRGHGPAVPHPSCAGPECTALYLWFDVLQQSISFEKLMKYSNGRGYRLRKMVFKWSYISLFSYYKILRIFSYWVSYPSTLVFVVISVKYLSFNKGHATAKAKCTQQIFIVATCDRRIFQLPHTADFYRW